MTTPIRQATCELHGEYTSRHFVGKVWSSCPICTEIQRQRESDHAAQLQARRRDQAWLNTLGHSQIPERFQSRTLDTYKIENAGQARAHAFATRYAADFGQRCAIFVGRPGTGKTHLAAGIAIAVMTRGHTALFTTTLRAIRRVKETWGRDAKETESQAVAALTYPSLLVLDEVGVQFGTNTERTILFDVLNERYESQKPCILISNLSLDGVRQQVGERVFDRLREGGGEAVIFDWESHRGTA